MPFFPQTYLPTEAALFQLLSELDQPQQKQQQQQQHPCVRRVHRPQTFTPRFDVTETNEAYELYGEVPGLQQSDLDIQFADAQTLIIKGKTERQLNTHTAAAAAAAAPEVEAEQTVQADAETSSQKSALSATVEDDYDEADTPLATPASASTSTSTAGPSAAEKGKQPESATVLETAATPRPRYWVAERKVGEFARSFTFEQRIEQDFVTAGLKNGVLHVVVPKSLKAKRVAVSVL
ncbi:putative 30 kDa heat shock protein [Rhexocercosporidium sp. MPI-PUGE-AT-0058]|nr:putative 30 kDa heat shock protein [Rhexocercosporidium sp. MPI-PUGE-AT-0058]